MLLFANIPVGIGVASRCGIGYLLVLLFTNILVGIGVA